MEIITLDETAEIFKVPLRKLKNWRKTGKIPKNCFTKIGNTVYGVRGVINQWLNSRVLG